MALGICPRDKLYRGYIDLEIQLREFDRCRTLYQKFLEHGPENCITWMRVSIPQYLYNTHAFVFTSGVLFSSTFYVQLELLIYYVNFMQFAELETLLGDVDRARAIYELAVNQPRLDMPEILWKAYIDFEISLEETRNARQLYERLLDRTHHVKVHCLIHFCNA